MILHQNHSYTAISPYLRYNNFTKKFTIFDVFTFVYDIWIYVDTWDLPRDVSETCNSPMKNV